MKKIINAIQSSKDFILKNILNRFLRIVDINDLENDENNGDNQQTVERPEWYLYSKNENKTTYKIQEYDKTGQQVDIIEKYKYAPTIKLLDIKIKNIIAHTPLSAYIENFNEAGIEYVSFQMDILNNNADMIYQLHNLRKENNEFLVDCRHIKINTKILHIKFYEYQNNNWKLDVLNGCIGDIMTADIIKLITNDEIPMSFIVLTKSYENKGTTKMNFTLACKAVMATTQGIGEQSYVINNIYKENGVDKTATTCGISVLY